MTDLPKGFYTGPDGRERFWDGKEWHDSPNHQPPKPDKTGLITRFKARKTATKALVLLTAAVIALSVVGAGIGALAAHNEEVAAQELAAQELAQQNEIAAEELAQEEKDKSDAATAKAEEAAAQQAKNDQNDAKYIAKGFSVAGPNLYYMFAPLDTYTCGSYFSCVYIVIAAGAEGCDRGVYVAASVMAGPGSIGSANGITAGLPAGGLAALKLDDLSGQDGNTFQITDVHCLG